MADEGADPFASLFEASDRTAASGGRASAEDVEAARPFLDHEQESIRGLAQMLVDSAAQDDVVEDIDDDEEGAGAVIPAEGAAFGFEEAMARVPQEFVDGFVEQTGLNAAVVRTMALTQDGMERLQLAAMRTVRAAEAGPVALAQHQIHQQQVMPANHWLGNIRDIVKAPSTLLAVAAVTAGYVIPLINTGRDAAVDVSVAQTGYVQAQTGLQISQTLNAVTPTVVGWIGAAGTALVGLMQARGG